MWMGLLNPASKKMENWDAVLIAVMLYTAFVTPCELAFVRQPAVNALFWCNQAVNLVFWCDLFLQFFIPVVGADGRTVRSHRRIAYIYLKGWFPLDLVSILPFDILDVAGTFTALGGANEEVVKLIRLTRLLKLLKLLRILRASRILARFETRYALTYTTNEMAKYTLVIIVTLHWFACAWAALATFSLDQPRTDALKEAVAMQQSDLGEAACPGCTPDDDPSAAVCTATCLSPCEVNLLAGLDGVNANLIYKRQHWMCRAADDGQITSDWDNIFELYIFCLLVALGQL